MRGQPVFMLSILLQCLEPILRQTAGVAPWQVRCLTRTAYASVQHMWQSDCARELWWHHGRYAGFGQAQLPSRCCMMLMLNRCAEAQHFWL